MELLVSYLYQIQLRTHAVLLLELFITEWPPWAIRRQSLHSNHRELLGFIHNLNLWMFLQKFVLSLWLSSPVSLAKYYLNWLRTFHPAPLNSYRINIFNFCWIILMIKWRAPFASKKWTILISHWRQAMVRFMIEFGFRLDGQIN